MGDRADVKVGFACNNRCVFCAQGDKRSEVKAVPLQELVRRLEEVRAPGRGLVLTGGEPTVHKQLAQVVAAAKWLGFRPIQLQTNGRMLSYRRLLDGLVGAGVTEISPALHGPTAEVHDALTRAPGSFAQTVEGIRNALAAGLPVITNTVVVRGNLAHLPATVRPLAALGVTQAQLALVPPVGTAAELFDEVVPPLPEAARAIRAALESPPEGRPSLVVEAVPPCFLRGHEDAVVEGRIPETTVVDLDGAPFGFTAWRTGEGKAKGPPCARCARAATCEGPWREFPARWGWEGYEPFEEPDVSAST